MNPTGPEFDTTVLNTKSQVRRKEDESLLTASAVVKWDGLAFGAFPGCVTRCFTLTSQFLPPRPTKVTIYTTQCRHFLSFFFFKENLWICEATKDSSGASSKEREKRARFVGCILDQPLDRDSLRMALWPNWPSNAPPKDAHPELRHSNSEGANYEQNSLRHHSVVCWKSSS